MSKIVLEGNKILRKKAKEIKSKEFNSPALLDMITKMREILATRKDGVALAGPQAGFDKRIFIVSPNIFDIPEIEDMVFINPEIIKKSKDQKKMEEGCLSVPFKYGTVKRASRITVRAYDRNGKEFEKTGTGLLAQIFQHEIDHLDGILFVDKATNLRELKPEDYE